MTIFQRTAVHSILIKFCVLDWFVSWRNAPGGDDLPASWPVCKVVGHSSSFLESDILTSPTFKLLQCSVSVNNCINDRIHAQWFETHNECSYQVKLPNNDKATRQQELPWFIFTRPQQNWQRNIILSTHHHFQPSNNYFPVSFNIPVFVWKK